MTTTATNCISQILLQDLQHAYLITTYIDIDGLDATDATINDYMCSLICKHDILSKTALKTGSTYFYETHQNIDDPHHYRIEYCDAGTFDSYTMLFLNETMTTPWNFLFCVDKGKHKVRMYFKIHHGYADGYQVIDILTTGFSKQPPGIAKRREAACTSSTMYYYILGTIMLIIMNIQVVFKILTWSSPPLPPTSETDFIVCQPLALSQIKLFAKLAGITVNDYLYCLMLKTDALYHGRKRTIFSCSPINVSGTKDTNNMAPIFILSANTFDSNCRLFQHVHGLFNQFKYSLFIPLLFLVITNVLPNLNIYSRLSGIYTSIMDSVDYSFSNIVGPTLQTDKVSVTDIHFLTTAKSREIVYNIISSGDKINIILSFRRGVVADKERLNRCLRDAHQNLIAFP